MLRSPSRSESQCDAFADVRRLGTARSTSLSLFAYACLLVGSPAFAQQESDNRVLELDGEGAHVELPVAAFRELTEATVEAWVRWDEWGFYSQWFSYGSDKGPWRAMGLNHFSYTATPQFFAYAPPAPPSILAVQTGIDLGTWHHFAAVSGSAGMHLYLDGTRVASGEYSGGFARLGPDLEAFLGKSTWAANAYFRGGLDEVRLWSSARDVGQIRTDMSRPLSGNEPGLVALWNFDAGDGRDGTANGHDSVPHSGARFESAPFPGAVPPLRPTLIHGEVRSPNGALISAARVLFTHRSGDRIEANSQTGVFSVALPDSGVYTVGVTSDVARIAPQEIRSAPGTQLRLDLRPPPPSLVARWAGEGDLQDQVGDAHGRALGNVDFAPGVVGQAFLFDGESAISVPQGPGLNPDGSFALAAWVFPEANEGVVLDRWGDDKVWRDERAFSLQIVSGRRLLFSLSGADQQQDTAYHIFFTRANVLPLKAWTHVVGVWDADSGVRRLYANGLLVGQRVDRPGRITASQSDLGIGCHLHGPDNPTTRFHGRIDEVSFYNTSLSEDDIVRLYSAHSQALWPGEGNAVDATRSGHDGVAVGRATFASGIVGQGFAFDGTDGYYEFDSRIGNYGSHDFTVEMWLQPSSIGDRRSLLVKGESHIGSDSYGAGQRALNLSIDNAGHIDIMLAGRLDTLRVGSTKPLRAGRWHHLVLVRENRYARLFLDGTLDKTAAAERVVSLQTPHPLLLGGSAQVPSFDGYLDEVALHRRALSPDEIHASYERITAAWRWRLWRTRLQTWGSLVLGLFALGLGARYLSQRRQRRREREQLAAEQHARQEADAANEAKSAFLANMSHEIRTPMNAIMGHAQLLRDDEEVDDDQRRRSVAAICEQGDMLLGMIDDILDLSKAEAGHMELQDNDFDLAELLDGLEMLFDVRCRQKGLRLQVRHDLPVTAMRGDESKLRQVLVNLLGNAVKFTDEGDVSLIVTAVDDEYLFEVRDTGPGITPEFQQVIFQPFRQGASGLASGGTGLGLAISQRHISLMGGRLELASEPDEGACFSFRIPLRRSAAAPVESAKAAAVSSEDLTLPADLRSRLLHAAQMQNLTEVKRCLDELRQLGEPEARLAASLATAVQRFDLRPLIEAMERTGDG